MANTESINIKPILKRFLEKKKIDFKEETGEFYGVSAVLMRYLEGNTKFLMDFQAYCKEKRERNSSEETTQDELLGLLTKPTTIKRVNP